MRTEYAEQLRKKQLKKDIEEGRIPESRKNIYEETKKPSTKNQVNYQNDQGINNNDEAQGNAAIMIEEEKVNNKYNPVAPVVPTKVKHPKPKGSSRNPTPREEPIDEEDVSEENKSKKPGIFSRAIKGIFG